MAREEDNRIVLNLNETGKKKALKKLNNLILQFLQGKYNDFVLYFENPLRITEDKFLELLGHYNSSRGKGYSGNIEEEYVYIVNKEKTDSGKCILSVKRIYVKFKVEDNNNKIIYMLHYVKGITEEIEITEDIEYNCNNS